MYKFFRFSLASLVFSAGLRSVSAAPAARTPSNGTYETVKIGEGIYAFIAPEPKTDLVSGNSVAVIGDDGVLIFDTTHFPATANRMIADLKKLTDKPVRFVVNSHWHQDHLTGNAAYAAAYPGVVVVAHAFTSAQIEKRVAKYGSNLGSRLPEYVKPLEEALASGNDDTGNALSPEQRRENELELSDLRAVKEDLAGMTYRAADVTFQDAMDIHLGKRLVRVTHPGRGNTAGDVMIFVPDAGVLATGDIVVAPIPYAYGGYPSEWTKILKEIAAMPASTIVPGHGPVMRDFGYVERVIALFESIGSQVRQAFVPGATLEDVRKKVDLEKFRLEFAGADPHRNSVFNDSITGPAVERAFQEIQFETE